MVDDLKPIPEDVSQNIFDADFWRKFGPKFTISDQKDDTAFDLGADALAQHRAKLVREGYTHVEQPGLNSPLSDMTSLFSDMVDKGVPPVFAFVYDEFWHLSLQLQKLLRPMFDDTAYAVLPDFWAWHVAPGQSGWTPHRDKLAGCLYSDRRPKSLTVWIPLTVAMPANGCMSLVPAHLDQNYGKVNPEGGITPVAMRSLADIRALPGQAGDIFVWTQHVFHWGGHSADNHELGPRMSVAFEYQRLDVDPFNTPLLSADTLPTFEERLALIAKQVKQYTHMYKFGPDLIEIADRIQEKHELPESVQA